MVKTKKQKRDAYLRRVYGISLDQYNELLKKQGGGCAICGKTPEQEGRALAVDHRHQPPYEITGILCYYHNNKLIGKHKDPDLFRRAAEYLERHTGWFVPVKSKRSKKKKRKRKSVRS